MKTNPKAVTPKMHRYTLRRLLGPSHLNRIRHLAYLVERRYAVPDDGYPWLDIEENFEEGDALSLQNTPYWVMRHIVRNKTKAIALFFEAGRGCCGIDSEYTYPTVENFKAVAQGTTPTECCADWCSKYWKEVKTRILSIVGKEGIGALDIDAICASEQYTDKPIWFKWNDIEGCIVKAIRILRSQKELNDQLIDVKETTTEEGLGLF